MLKKDGYEYFQNLIFEELDALETAADQRMVEVVIMFSEKNVRMAAARGIDCPRQCKVMIPEERLLGIEPDRTKWSETVREILVRGIGVRGSQIRQIMKRRKARGSDA
jgi:hypothetical protein